MHNHFIYDLFPHWLPQKPSRTARFINGILRGLGIKSRLGPPHPITGYLSNIEQRINMYHLSSQVLAYEIPGDFVEVGCHSGQSAVLLQEIIGAYDPSRNLHVYDSFEGLPALSAEDGDTQRFYKGRYSTAKQNLIENFKKCNTRLPVIHQGWFDQTLPDGLPEKIAFAHLDGDLYDSIKISLEYVYPKLSKGAVCLIHDYSDLEVFPDGFHELPGVKKAVDEYMIDKPEEIICLYCGPGFSHAFFRKI